MPSRKICHRFKAYKIHENGILLYQSSMDLLYFISLESTVTPNNTNYSNSITIHYPPFHQHPFHSSQKNHHIYYLLLLLLLRSHKPHINVRKPLLSSLNCTVSPTSTANRVATTSQNAPLLVFPQRY